MNKLLVRVRIESPNGLTTYVIVVPEGEGSLEGKIHKTLGASIVLGASLLDASWACEGDYRVAQEPEVLDDDSMDGG